MKFRICVVAMIQNQQDEYLLCKKPDNLGVYPGQWALVGGGVEKGESLEEALKREVEEEVGIELNFFQPFSFGEDTAEKILRDGTKETNRMLFLLYSCKTENPKITLNDEFETFAWVHQDDIKNYDLNAPTRETFRNLKILES